MELSRKLVVKHGKLNLKDWDPGFDAGKTKEEAEREISHFSTQMSKLQYKLFADSSKSLLIILQGVDASGKDGTIRHVMGSLNPQSCYVKAFKVPTTQELSHDYLWRVHMAIPPKGQVAIFNRSHYEDVIEARVRNLVPKNELTSRYRQINDFERYLSENQVVVLKFFLHVSKDEQKKRLQERLEHPTRHWKISERDFQDREDWEKYMEAYEETLRTCSTSWATWYIVPANLKWFRNWAVSQIVVSTLDSMKLKFPEPRIDLSKFTID